MGVIEMEKPLSSGRILTEEEQRMVWRKPASHVTGEVERRVCRAIRDTWDSEEMRISTILLEGAAGSGKTQLAKALSADLGLLYTKVTCFADMDKSDVLGSILPVMDGEEGEVSYRSYPSEIVRAYENGWLLEIQEPTVIRDAGVLMMLNSALEPDGSINLPTRIARRHPDFIAVITTNRSYNGCRPLNEALRDRVQHAEKMDLPPLEAMMERAAAKTACQDERILRACGEIVARIDEAAQAHGVKGVAGMRSYLQWVDDIARGDDIRESLYRKVIYKVTTDPDEIALLLPAFERDAAEGTLVTLEALRPSPAEQGGAEEIKLRADGSGELSSERSKSDSAVRVRRSSDSEGHTSARTGGAEQTRAAHAEGDGDPIYHEVDPAARQVDEADVRAAVKGLNHAAREAVRGSMHERVGMIVRHAESGPEDEDAYRRAASVLHPVIEELRRRVEPLLEHEVAAERSGGRLYGTMFHAERAVAPDLRHFSRRNPPHENPSLAVALRIDQSASMNAYGRLEAAKSAAIAVSEFCDACGIPAMIYGDTADRSPRERMSMYVYRDWAEPALDDPCAIMSLSGISNNRDGMALRVLADRLAQAPQRTKLLISLSDGQPKAMPDYTGSPRSRTSRRWCASTAAGTWCSSRPRSDRTGRRSPRRTVRSARSTSATWRICPVCCSRRSPGTCRGVGSGPGVPCRSRPRRSPIVATGLWMARVRRVRPS